MELCLFFSISYTIITRGNPLHICFRSLSGTIVWLKIVNLLAGLVENNVQTGLSKVYSKLPMLGLTYEWFISELWSLRHGICLEALLATNLDFTRMVHD